MQTRTGFTGAIMLAVTAAAITISPAEAHDPNTPAGWAAAAAIAKDQQPAARYKPITGVAAATCQNGKAGGYPCQNVDLLSALPLGSMGGGNGNSLWGWTDPGTGKEYVIFGRTNGVAFIDVSTPTSPRYLGNLPSHDGVVSTWRDIKVYANHAYIGADFWTTHGLQVFDLTRLRTVTTPQTFAEDAHYAGFEDSHTLAVNEETGFIYAAGTETCGFGLHIVNVRIPKQPIFAGCVGGDGYVHESQCVVYHGPDVTYQGQEICFNYNQDTLTVVDVTEKSAPRQLSRSSYTGVRYAHQGWLTADHARLILNDEGDNDPRTLIWDVSDLDAPVHSGTYNPTTVGSAIDHNEYVVGNRIYQAHYRAGLRILDASSIASNSLREVGFFDIYPADDNAGFNGAWNNYPFFPSGIVAISGIEQGLFLVRPRV